MVAKPLLIDTDPGMDDAVAILTAFGSPNAVDIRLISTVGGNVPLAMCTSNALRLCEFAGRGDIPVHEGCPKALLQPANAVFHVHGANGLGGITLPEPKLTPAGTHAVTALIGAIRNEPTPVTIAALAPLTNIALALTMAPDIIENIAEIVIMGGSFSGGNITPYASYNIHSDPHAAQITFNCGAPVTMVGLEITRQLKPDQSWLDILAKETARPARFVAELWNGSSLCFNDATVILAITRPDLFNHEKAHVEVNITDPERIGETTRSPAHPNICVATGINRTAAFAALHQALTARS